MNAEQITTEVVVGSDDEALYDDDDTATLSSVATTSEVRLNIFVIALFSGIVSGCRKLGACHHRSFYFKYCL